MANTDKGFFHAIKAAEAERADHLARRPADVVAAMTGDPAAAARVAAIDQALAGLDARVRDLHEAQGELRRRRAAEDAAARQREAAARPKRIAELRRERLQLMAGVTEAMVSAAAVMKATARNAQALKAELGDEAGGSFLDFQSYRMRVQSAFALAFALDLSKPLTEGNSLLGIRSREVGDRVHWTAMQHEQCGMDDLAPFFTDLAEAEAARERLAARNTRVIVVALGEVFTLVQLHRVFGDRAAADQAASADAAARRPTAIIPHEGGFVLVPERFSGKEAA